ncbi:MAG: phosphoglycerate kinase [Candidatus Levybacteria bacterium]|nr:phosphoglycerate kinase [Candidatus Levybacteria bacterium]
MKLRELTNINVAEKRILLRCDFDTPSHSFHNDLRVVSSLDTINYLLSKKSTVVVVSHRGRPKGKEEELSLFPIASYIATELKTSTHPVNIGEFSGWQVGESLLILENIRFFKEEEENNETFSRKLSALGDLYVNDAFASSHRKSASIVGITSFLPSYAGPRLILEAITLSKIIDSPKRPLTIIIGGSKIETKLPLVEKMHHFADYVLVGGEIAEQDKILLRIQHDRKKAILLVADVTPEKDDITQKSLENFIQVIKNSKTVVWNGPMGFLEKGKTFTTFRIAEEISDKVSYSVVGGGDTLSFLSKKNLLDDFTFVSSGGGAMLEFLSGGKLPGLEILSG